MLNSIQYFIHTSNVLHCNLLCESPCLRTINNPTQYNLYEFGTTMVYPTAIRCDGQPEYALVLTFPAIYINSMILPLT